jgi:ankyrin repeat protein
MLVLITLFCSTIRTMQELSTAKPLLAQITQELVKREHKQNINRLFFDIDRCLLSGASLDACDKEKNTALHKAAKADHVATIEYLLYKKVNINAQNNKGHTPLITAITQGHQISTFALIQAGADVNLADNKGRSPLYHAIGKKTVIDVNIPVVTRLLQAGANPDITHKHRTAFDSLLYKKSRVTWMSKIHQNLQDLYQLVLRYGVDPNKLHLLYPAALHLAVRCESPMLVRVLLKAGANVDAIDTDNKTALEYAIELYSKEAIKESLIEYKAKVAPRRFREGLKAYCTTGHYKVAQDYLGSITANFQNAEQCFKAAIALGNIDIVELLAATDKPHEYYLYRHVKPLPSSKAFGCWVNQEGNSSADIARRNGFEELALYLVSKGSKFINRAAFHDAVYKKDTVKLTKLLEESKTNTETAKLLEFRDCAGNTPLHLAADMPYAPNFELIYKQANPFAQNNDNRTPLQLIFNNPCPGDLTFVASDLLAPHVATILSKSLGNPVLEPEENTIAVVGKIDELAAYIASYLAGAHLHNLYDKCIDNAPLTRSKKLMHDLYTLKVITSPR